MICPGRHIPPMIDSMTVTGLGEIRGLFYRCRDYNEFRPHSSVENMTPAQFAELSRQRVAQMRTRD